MRLTTLNIYPIKSLHGIPLSTALIEPRGLKFDRRWMLVDENNRFITQREFPSLARLKVGISNSELTVSAGNHRRISLPLVPEGNDFADVAVWRSRVNAKVYEERINGWFSEFLKTECKLVVMTESSKREVNPEYAVGEDDCVSFADGYPFMLLGESSLNDLNSRLQFPVPMSRFRPNFVVSGSDPFAEDSWKRIRIGKTNFFVVKPCERCIIPTIDQEKGIRVGDEPLKTLSEYRKTERGVLFGQNLIAENFGEEIRVGDDVEILETR